MTNEIDGSAATLESTLIGVRCHSFDGVSIHTPETIVHNSYMRCAKFLSRAPIICAVTFLTASESAHRHFNNIYSSLSGQAIEEAGW